MNVMTHFTHYCLFYSYKRQNEKGLQCDSCTFVIVCVLCLCNMHLINAHIQKDKTKDYSLYNKNQTELHYSAPMNFLMRAYHGMIMVIGFERNCFFLYK